MNISTENIVLLRESSFLGGYGTELDSLFNSFFGFRTPARELKLNSVGSGIIIDKQGLIATNAHVVKMASTIFVILNDGTQMQGKVVFEDVKNDLAIVRVTPTTSLVEIVFADSEDVMIGETAVAIGNPLGLENSVSVGVVSGVGRDFYGPHGDVLMKGLIQTDAPINPGNSGGALLNLDGELFGISVAVVQNSQSIGFAVPVDRIVAMKKAYIDGQDSFEQDSVVSSGSKRISNTDSFPNIESVFDSAFNNVDMNLHMDFGKEDIFDTPDFEISDEGDEYKVIFDVTDLNKDSIKATINYHQLRISAKRSSKVERQEEGRNFRAQSFGSFVKTIPVPKDADTKKMVTELIDDELIITIPKK